MKKKGKGRVNHEESYLENIKSKYGQAIRDQFESLSGLKKRLEDSKKLFKSSQNFEKYKIFEVLIAKNFGHRIRPEVNCFLFKSYTLSALILELLQIGEEKLIIDIVTNYLGVNFKYLVEGQGQDILELACFTGDLRMIKLCVGLKNSDINQISLDLKSSRQDDEILLYYVIHNFFLINEYLKERKRRSVQLLDVRLCNIIQIIDYFCDLGLNLDAENDKGHNVLSKIVNYLFKKNKSIMTFSVIFVHLVEKGASLKIKDYRGGEGKEFLKYVFELRGIEKELEKCYDIVHRKLFELLKKPVLNPEKIEEILAKNYVNLEVLDEKSCNFLHYAAWRGYKKNILKLFVSRGNINQRDRFGMTPILYAADNNNFETIFELIELGADITVPNILGQTLMHYAASNGCIMILELSKHNRDLLLAKTKKGYLPIHRAVSRGSLEAVEYLVNAGQDINEVTNDGSTMLDIALREGHMKIFEYLLSVGAMNIKNKVTNLSKENSNAQSVEDIQEVLKAFREMLPSKSFSGKKERIYRL